MSVMGFQKTKILDGVSGLVSSIQFHCGFLEKECNFTKPRTRVVIFRSVLHLNRPHVMTESEPPRLGRLGRTVHHGEEKRLRIETFVVEPAAVSIFGRAFRVRHIVVWCVELTVRAHRVTCQHSEYVVAALVI